MTDLSTLSAKKLHEVIARRNAHWTKTLDATIAAGMGHMRFSDIVECAKGSALLHKTKLARDYLNARHDWKIARDELDARMTYQGNDKPIKRDRRAEAIKADRELLHEELKSETSKGG